MRLRSFALGLFVWLLSAGVAIAASCTSYPFTLTNGQTADATQVMTNFNTVRNCVINNAASSGANSDITSILGLTTPLSPSQGGTPLYVGGTSTGSANAQAVATLTPIGFTLTPGFSAYFTAGFSNTSATVTLNLNATGAVAIKTVKKGVLSNLAVGDIIAGINYYVVYDGTQYELVNPSTFALGGDITGTTVTSTVTGIQGISITSTAPTSTQVLTYSGTNNDWEPQNPAGGKYHKQVFTSSGTFTPTVTTVYKITVVGSGGGGGGNSASGDSHAGGGGAGSTGIGWQTLTANTGYTVTVGTGGAGGANTGGTGGTGPSSSFAGTSTITATGGVGGTGVSSASTSGSGGAGGTSTNGDINIPGGEGFSGAGGSSAFGGGNGGASTQGGGSTCLTTGAPNNATVYGSGGAGSGFGTSAAAHAGGNGAPGIVIVEWVN